MGVLGLIMSLYIFLGAGQERAIARAYHVDQAALELTEIAYLSLGLKV